MNHPVAFDPTVLTHVRTVISIIVGLSVGRLLTGLARFVQHPSKQKIFLVHLVWTFFMLIYVILFWWWEFRLTNVQWTFGPYLFIAVYASTFFFLCTLLFPDNLEEYDGFADYFMSRRKWFFGFLIATFVLDILDTFIKGSDYAHALGPEYWVRFAFFVGGSLLAVFVRNGRFQLTFAVLAVLYEIVWALNYYDRPI